MPQRITYADHAWVIAATVKIDGRDIRKALARKTHTLACETKISVLDVYCTHCRRNWVDVNETSCAAANSNEHLIGGPTGTRRRRAAMPVPQREAALDEFLAPEPEHPFTRLG